jgi:hypothetical protein
MSCDKHISHLQAVRSFTKADLLLSESPFTAIKSAHRYFTYSRTFTGWFVEVKNSTPIVQQSFRCLCQISAGFTL